MPDLAGKSDELEAMLTSLTEEFRFSTSEQAWALLFVCLAIDNIKSFLKKWKTSNDFQRSVVKLAEIYQLRQAGPVTKQICFKYGKEFLYLVEELRQAQGLVTDFAAIDKIDQALTIHDKHEIVVNGGHLMKTFDLKPGPVLGNLLKEVEFQIVEGQLENEEQAILTFVKGILENE